MRILHYKTYNSTPLGFGAGKWNHKAGVFGTQASKGWYVNLTYKFNARRYVLQIRHEG